MALRLGRQAASSRPTTLGRNIGPEHSHFTTTTARDARWDFTAPPPTASTSCRCATPLLPAAPASRAAPIGWKVRRPSARFPSRGRAETRHAGRTRTTVGRGVSSGWTCWAFPRRRFRRTDSRRGGRNLPPAGDLCPGGDRSWQVVCGAAGVRGGPDAAARPRRAACRRPRRPWSTEMTRVARGGGLTCETTKHARPSRDEPTASSPGGARRSVRSP